MTKIYLSEEKWGIPPKKFDVFYGEKKIDTIVAHFSKEALEKAIKKLGVREVAIP
jgi:hypothetical protein